MNLSDFPPPSPPSPWQAAIYEAMQWVDAQGWTYAQCNCSTAVWRASERALNALNQPAGDLRRWIDCRVDLDPRWHRGMIPTATMSYVQGGPMGLIACALGCGMQLQNAAWGNLLQMWQSEAGSTLDPKLIQGHAAIFLAFGTDPKQGRPCVWLWSSHPPGQAAVDGPGVDWYLVKRSVVDDGLSYDRWWLCGQPLPLL